MTRLLAGHRVVWVPILYLIVIRLILFPMFGITNRLEVEAKVPYVYRSDTSVGREVIGTSRVIAGPRVEDPQQVGQRGDGADRRA